MDQKSPEGPPPLAPGKDAPPAYSAPDPHSIEIKHIFACLTLNDYDKIRLLGFPEETIELVRRAIITGWRNGIQREQSYHGAHEFKLVGNPWAGFGSEAIPARVLVCTVLGALYGAGWHLSASTDITKKLMDKDSMFFRLAAVPPPPTTFFSVSFNEGDKLRLIQAPPEVIEAVKHVLGQKIQKEEWKLPEIGYQFKMYGYPWYANGSETVTTRVLLMHILDVLHAYGWEMHATVDMSKGNNGEGMDTDTWFLRKVAAPASPVPGSSTLAKS